MRLQDQRSQRRRQRQRTEAGDCGSNRDGDGELLEELTGDTAEECRWHEHRAEHQRDRHQRAADLLHGFQRRIAPAHALPEMAFDILDHDDRVVDHDADREHEAEQRKIVDAKTERGHRREGADQRHRDGRDRDDRRPPALQKYQHDDDDQNHRLIDGLDQFMDRLGDEFGWIVADIVVEPLRKACLQPGHGIGDALGRGQRVRAGALGHQHRDRGLAQQEAVGGIIQRAKLDPRHVAQPHDAAVLAGLDDDVLELRGILQPAGEGQVRLEGAVGDRRAGELAAGDLQILGADRGNDIARGQAQVGDLVGIEPQPHRIVARAEDLDVADAVEPQQLVTNLQQRVIARCRAGRRCRRATA